MCAPAQSESEFRWDNYLLPLFVQPPIFHYVRDGVRRSIFSAISLALQNHLKSW